MKENKRTEIISFRVPEEIAEKIDKTARERGKFRSTFVKETFMPVFRQIANLPEPEPEKVTEPA
jgi:predicted DNA-binding protein